MGTWLKPILLVASVMFSLCVGEMLARLMYPPQRKVSWYHYDSQYGFRHRANADAPTNDWGDGDFWRFRTNARGFRGPDWNDVPASGTTRALVVGDSFAFGDGVDEDGAFPQVAHAALAATGRHEVLNLGVSAWGPDNALAYLETEGSSIRASCLVFSSFESNDVIDVATHGLYAVEDGAFRRVVATSSPPTAKSLMRDAFRSLPLYDGLLAHSQLFNVLRTGAINALSRQEFKQAGGDRFQGVSRPAFEAALSLYEQTLTHLMELGRARFGAFAVLQIPMREQLDREFGKPPAYPIWMADAAYERVKAWAARHRVPVLDVRDLSSSLSQQERRDLYFEKDFHLSSTGHLLVGRALGQRLPELCAPVAGR